MISCVRTASFSRVLARGCVALAFVCLADLAAGQHASRLVAVPCKHAIIVDGDLRDWDLSSAIEVAYDQLLAPKFMARFAMMYDTNALYLAAHFNDDSPLRNRHDPRIDPQNAWRGDALQVRLTTDPKMPLPLHVSIFAAGERDAASTDPRIVHLTFWEFSDRGESCLMVQHGMDFHDTKILTGKESGIAFRADANGQGYTLEARLPWALLGVAGKQKPPQGGDRVALTIQPLWGTADGDNYVLSFGAVEAGVGFHFQTADKWGVLEFSPKGNLPPEKRAVAPQFVSEPLTIELPIEDADAKMLSAAVFDSLGELVRTLPSTILNHQFSVPRCRFSFHWNGLDDDGRPLAPGDYTIKFLTHHGVAERWLTSLDSAGDPPWKTDDGRGAWGGDHGPPVAVAAGGGRVFLGWAFSEAGFTTIGVDEKLPRTGKPKKYWGAPSVLEIGITTTAMASDGEHVFVGQDGKRFGEGRQKDAPNRAGVVIWNSKTGRAEDFPFGKRILEIEEWQSPVATPRTLDEGAYNLAGLAVSGDLLYASLRRDNKIAVFNWKTGARGREISVPSPRALAVDEHGDVIAISEKNLLWIDPQSCAIKTLVSGLSDPAAVALGRDNQIYVADGGDAMQVKVFALSWTASHERYSNTDNSRSGRQSALSYELRRTIGKEGGRRKIGRYDPAGMLNPSALAIDGEGKIWVAENDNTPRRVSVWSESGTLMGDLLGPGGYAAGGAADPMHPEWINTQHVLFQLDYASGAAKTLATLVRATPPGLEFGGVLQMRHAHGFDYAVAPLRRGMKIYRVDPQKLVGEPVAALGAPNTWRILGITPDSLSETERAKAQEKLNGKASFVWTDRNGDRLVQLDEIESGNSRGGPWNLYWGSWIDDALTIWSANESDNGNVWRVPVKRFLADGTPVYPEPAEQEPLFTTIYKTMIHHVMPAPDGNSVYVIEQDGGSWVVGGGKRMAISRYNLDGKRLWAYRKAWTGFSLEAPLFRPGYVIGAMKFIGTGGGQNGVPPLIAVNGYYGQFSILTADGLWVAALGSDNRFSPPMSSRTYYCENFSGCFFRNQNNGRHYLIAGETDTRISEIEGLETIRTGSAKLTLSKTDQAKAAVVAAHLASTATEAKQLTMRRMTNQKSMARSVGGNSMTPP
jgi:hypothetical protein